MVQTTAVEFVRTLKEAGLFDHLGEAEFRDFVARAARMPLISPPHKLDILDAARETIWYFKDASTPQANAFTHLRSMARDHSAILENLGDSGEPVTAGEAVDKANASLAGAGSDDRFYFLVLPDDGQNGPIRLWAAVYLTYAQRQDPGIQRLLPLAPDQRLTWMPRRVRDLFAHLDELGLLEPYPASEIAAIKDEILQWEDDKVEGWQILMEIPGLCETFDTEMIYDLQDDYRRLIENTAELSRGIFQPSNIQVSGSGQYWSEIQISFDWRGAHFEHTLKDRGDWVDVGYLEMLNAALAAMGGRGSFHTLWMPYDQCIRVLFLDGPQTKKALAARRLPLAIFYQPSVQ